MIVVLTRGFTLIEVMFSGFIFSLMLLGLFQVQGSFIQKIRGDLYLEQAVALSQNMVVYLRKHPGDYSNYQEIWGKQIQSSLPSGRGWVARSLSHYQIKILWGKADESCQHNQSGITGCVVLTIQI